MQLHVACKMIPSCRLYDHR